MNKWIIKCFYISLGSSLGKVTWIRLHCEVAICTDCNGITGIAELTKRLQLVREDCRGRQRVLAYCKIFSSLYSRRTGNNKITSITGIGFFEKLQWIANVVRWRSNHWPISLDFKKPASETNFMDLVLMNGLLLWINWSKQYRYIKKLYEDKNFSKHRDDTRNGEYYKRFIYIQYYCWFQYFSSFSSFEWVCNW